MSDNADFAALAEPSEQQRWAEYERRKWAWIADNPGAWAGELQDFCARLRQELGL